MFDAIFFDLDGTLVDTERLSVRAGLTAFAELGFPTDTDFLHSLVGVDQPTAGGIISRNCPGIDLTDLLAAWDRAALHEGRNGIPLKPHAAEVVAHLAAWHPMAVVTSSGPTWAASKLAQTGLADCFRMVITRQDVTAPKPAPDPYLLAARRLGADPARCLVFEDSEPGAEAGFRAGMKVIQVPDLIAPSGRFAHHIATDLRAGAIWAGLLD